MKGDLKAKLLLGNSNFLSFFRQYLEVMLVSVRDDTRLGLDANFDPLGREEETEGEGEDFFR